MLRASARGALYAAGIALALSFPACGKKGPPRLTDSRPPEHAPALRARMREGRVTLDFRVPGRRQFPEIEEPWVLARILRQATPTSEFVEAGAILETGGFAFDAPLTWSDQVLPAKSSLIFRVEFRDAARRRRALSAPLAVSWDQEPAAPTTLTAVGHLRSIVLTWTPADSAGAGMNYRVYRREVSQPLFEPAAPTLVPGVSFVDSRIEPGGKFCYVVRAVLDAKALEVEGPASPESCARPVSEELLTP